MDWALFILGGFAAFLLLLAVARAWVLGITLSYPAGALSSRLAHRRSRLEKPMKREERLREFHKAVALGLVLGVVATRAAALEPIPIAVLDFDYTDSSGEPGDQTALHRARLGAFAARIRAALAGSGAYRVVVAACTAPPCSAKNYAPEELFTIARHAGAKLMLFGGLHKMSTLVQWGRVELVDVGENRLIDDRHLSFRGDDDQAWRRAADYVAQKLINQGGGEEPRQ